jgi:hypothetical protein
MIGHVEVHRRENSSSSITTNDTQLLHARKVDCMASQSSTATCEPAVESQPSVHSVAAGPGPSLPPWDDDNTHDGGWVPRVRERFANDADCIASCRLLVTFSTAYLVALSVHQGPLYRWLMSKSRESCRRDSAGRIKMGPLIDTLKKANANTINLTLQALHWCRYARSSGCHFTDSIPPMAVPMLQLLL